MAQGTQHDDEERIRRLRELSDRLIVTAEVVERHFGEAVDVKRQLDDLVAALGAAADRTAELARVELDVPLPTRFRRAEPGVEVEDVAQPPSSGPPPYHRG